MALKIIRQIFEGLIAADGAVNDASATTTSFITTLLGPQVFEDVSLVMINGDIGGESKPIISHDIDTGEVVLSEGFSSAPLDGATFNLNTTHVHPVTQISAAVWAETIRSLTTGAGITDEQMTEAYAADGVEPTFIQALYLIQQMLTEYAITGTTLGVKKLDGVTPAVNMTLNDAAEPSSITRS